MKQAIEFERRFAKSFPSVSIPTDLCEKLLLLAQEDVVTSMSARFIT